MSNQGVNNDWLGQDYWENRWTSGNITWLPTKPHWLLQKYENLILDGKKDAQVFLPLCGNTPDLKWFYERGHRVIGVEFVEEAARSFFENNDLPFETTISEDPQCAVLQTPDRRLRIFVCNIVDFKRTCAGPMDIVWDKGATGSFPEESSLKYYKVIKDLLAKDFSFGLVSVIYDDSAFPGRTPDMTEEKIREYMDYPYKMRDEMIYKYLGDLKPQKIAQAMHEKTMSAEFPFTECLWYMKG